MEELAGLGGIRSAYLFGSWAARYAGEEGRPPADVDLLVIGEPGRQKIGELLDQGELGQMPADEEVAKRRLADAALHLASAAAARDMGDHVGAYQLAYDALRKSAALRQAAAHEVTVFSWNWRT